MYDKAPFGTITKCVDYAGFLIFKCPNTLCSQQALSFELT